MSQSSSLWGRWTRGVRRTAVRDDWPTLAGDARPDCLMTLLADGDYHAKQGRSTGRALLQGPAGKLPIYLKRHYQLAWWRRLLALFWPQGGWSPAMTEYRRLHEMRALGIRVPEAIAAGEFIGPGLRLQSFLAVEELRDMLPLHKAVPLAQQTLPQAVFARWKRRVAEEIGRMVRRLHQAGLFHKDLYLCHFFIARADIGVADVLDGRLCLIDLHRLARHRFWLLRHRIKDLAQLWFSMEWPGLTRCDRLRCFRAYLGASRLDWAGRRLLAAVQAKASLYRRHNDKHPRLMPDRMDRREAAS